MGGGWGRKCDGAGQECSWMERVWVGYSVVGGIGHVYEWR